jgi:hypothetical protein
MYHLQSGWIDEGSQRGVGYTMKGPESPHNAKEHTM